MPTLGVALLKALRAHGAREIFGIPGDFVLPFCKVIEDSGVLPFYTLSHEPAIGFAADAVARFRASLSVAVVTWGAGAFNLVNAVAGAYAERSPVVVVSGAPGVHERASGWQLHHMARALDTQVRIYREITCDQAVLDDPVRAPADIARVLRRALDTAAPMSRHSIESPLCGPLAAGGSERLREPGGRLRDSRAVAAVSLSSRDPAPRVGLRAESDPGPCPTDSVSGDAPSRWGQSRVTPGPPRQRAIVGRWRGQDREGWCWSPARFGLNATLSRPNFVPYAT